MSTYKRWFPPLLIVDGITVVAGAGKDIQKGGESLENSAEKHKSTN